MKRSVAVLAACCVLGVRLAAGPAQGPGLLYASNRTGNSDIFLMNPDGTGARNLTDDKGEDTFPAWSPDGKQIAFTSDRNGSPDIYVMDADGSNVKQLTRDKGTNRAPAWSPDGKQIAFTSDRDGNYEIYIMDADGSNQTNRSNNPAYDADPAWSPDGKQIVFASNRGQQGFRLCVMDADGRNVRELSRTANPFGYVYPAWSPDGKQIAYGDHAANSVELFVCAADGSKPKQLTQLGGQNSLAAWSPDGKTLAFQHVSPGDNAGSLYLMKADGSDPKEILNAEGPIEGGRPAWKPKERANQPAGPATRSRRADAAAAFRKLPANRLARNLLRVKNRKTRLPAKAEGNRPVSGR